MHSENARVFYLSQTYQWATLPLTPCVTLGESLELTEASLCLPTEGHRIYKLKRAKETTSLERSSQMPFTPTNNLISFFSVNIWGLLSGTPILDIFTTCEFVTHVLGKDSWQL